MSLTLNEIHARITCGCTTQETKENYDNLVNKLEDEITKLKKEILESEAVEMFIVKRLSDVGSHQEALKAHYREGKVIDGKWVNEEEEEEEEEEAYYCYKCNIVLDETNAWVMDTVGYRCIVCREEEEDSCKFCGNKNYCKSKSDGKMIRLHKLVDGSFSCDEGDCITKTLRSVFKKYNV